MQNLKRMHNNWNMESLYPPEVAFPALAYLYFSTTFILPIGPSLSDISPVSSWPSSLQFFLDPNGLVYRTVKAKNLVIIFLWQWSIAQSKHYSHSASSTVKSMDLRQEQHSTQWNLQLLLILPSVSPHVAVSYRSMIGKITVHSIKLQHKMSAQDFKACTSKGKGKKLWHGGTNECLSHNGICGFFLLWVYKECYIWNNPQRTKWDLLLKSAFLRLGS